jgi:phosphomannomutase
MRSDGIFLNQNQANKLLELYEKKDFKRGSPKTVVSNSSAIDVHIDKLLKTIDVTAIRHKEIRVALDCCNGAGSVAMIKLLQKLGCKIEAINCNPNLSFPHDPEPIAENLTELINLVKSRHAAVGFALDSDADRLAIISEAGEPIGEELTLALAEKFVLMKNSLIEAERKIVVTNLSTTKAIDDIAQANGAITIRTKIGEVHVSEELKNLNGLIGGEGNGGVIYPAVGWNRDGLAGMALILNFLAESNKSLSQLVAEIPKYYMIKKKIDYKNRLVMEDFIDQMKGTFKKADLIMTDGIKVVLPHLWLHVRPSNTEPVLRIIAEGEDKKEVETLVDQVIKSLS